MAIIKVLDNFIINEVKTHRINLDISQLELSYQINNTPESNLVGTCESNARATGYNDHHLNIFANYFTQKVATIDKEMIQALGLKENYEVKDFYPPEPILEEFIEKDIKNFSKNLKPSGAIRILVENKDEFLNSWRTIKEICDFCNVKFNQNWKQSDFTSILIYAKNLGKLSRFSEDVAHYNLNKTN